MKDALLLFDAASKFGVELEEHWKEQIGMRMITLASSNSLASNATRSRVNGIRSNVVTIATPKDVASLAGSGVLDSIATLFCIDSDVVNLAKLDMAMDCVLTSVEQDIAISPSTDVELVNSDIEVGAELDSVLSLEISAADMINAPDYRMELERIQALNDELTNETMHLTEKLKACMEDLKRLTEESQLLDSIQDELDDVRSKLAIATENLNVLTAEKASLTDKYNRLEIDYSSAITTRSELLKTDVRAELSAKESELRLSKDEVERLTAEIAKMAELHADALLEKEESSAKLRTEYDTLSALLSVKEAELSAKVLEHSELSSVHAGLVSEHGTMLTLSDNLQVELDNCKAALQALQTSSELISAQLTTTTVERDKLLGELDILREQLSGALSVDEVAELRAEIAAHKADSECSQDVIVRLRSEHTRVLEEVAQLRLASVKTSALFAPGAQILSSLKLESGLAKLGELKAVYNNVHVVAGLSNETDVNGVLAKLALGCTNTRLLFIDMAYTPYLDYYFQVKGAKAYIRSVAAWLNGDSALQDCINPINHHGYVYGSYRGMNDSAFLRIDWGSKFAELAELGYTTIINWGTAGSSVRDNLLNTWLNNVHVHLCAQGSALSLRAAIMQLQRFGYAQGIKFVAVDVLAQGDHKILDTIMELHKGPKQVIYYGSSDVMVL